MKKAVFIINKSSEARCQACIASINALKRPPHYKIKTVSYTAEDGYASNIYTIVQQKEEADITVILDDTVLLVNENLIRDIDRIFLEDSSVGIIGIKGAELMPDSGNIDDAANIYGGMYETDAAGNVLERRWNTCHLDYTPVEAIGSMLVAIRGYIPIWQDINSQEIGEIFSVAAAIQGYRSVVPQTSYNWCYSTVPEQPKTAAELGYIQRKYRFKHTLLAKDHYLLTIGIPTYNRVKYFSKCIENIYKTVGNMPWVEVFVSNNDSTDNTEKIAAKYLRYKTFRYYRQPVNITIRNIDYIYENARGDFVVACGDDDYYTPECILNLLEVICLHPDATVILLGWEKYENSALCAYGTGIDSYVASCNQLYTCISSVVLNQQRYLEIEVKDRFLYTSLNQCYEQLEMLRKAPKFLLMPKNYFLDDSGEAARGRIFKEEERRAFCNIFVRNYYPILDYFLDKGLSQEAYEKEKKENLKKILMWLWAIKNTGNTSQWFIDDDIEELIEEFYGYEPYYDSLKQEIAQIVGQSN